MSCRVVHARVESWLQESQERFDLIVSRAVTTLSELIQWSGQSLNKGGTYYILKGGDVKSEIDRARARDLDVIELSPDKEWREFSVHLKEKTVVKMEKVNV